jgi:putative polyhydroxyalkanoic acid system protein
MATLNMSIPYDLPPDEALRRIKAEIDSAKVDYPDKVRDLRETWNGNIGTFSATAMGHAFSAVLTVNPGTLVVQAQLPAAASFFRGMIETAIRQRVGSLLKA